MAPLKSAIRSAACPLPPACGLRAAPRGPCGAIGDASSGPARSRPRAESQPSGSAADTAPRIRPPARPSGCLCAHCQGESAWER